jgi:molybdate transport system substrate-binding protein
VIVESVGGVDAAKRVAAGEAFDAVFLAADAIDKLMASGHVVAGSRVDLVRSGVAVAVKAGAPRPVIDTEAAVRAAVLAGAEHRLLHRPERDRCCNCSSAGASRAKCMSA